MSIAKLSAALVNRYRIERELGEGGMATVYLAHDLKHDRPVAIKVLKPELAAVLGAERFVREIRTTAQLQHPNILPLFDSGTADGFLYYVMPVVDGESLRDKLNRETQCGVDETVKLMSEIADALHYAHQHGVVHRDIKPENILLHAGRPLVVDFGIALAVVQAGGQRMTQTGFSLGTPQYMSPEQAMGEREIGHRSDIYSLGAVTYEMLAGEPPFTGPSAQAIVARVMTEDPPSLAATRRSVPDHVDAAVRTALEKLPADRFGSASEFGAALTTPASRVGSARRQRTGRHWAMRAVPWAIAAIAVTAAVVMGAAVRRIPPPRTMRLAIMPEPGETIDATYRLAISSDGRFIVYGATRGGVTSLYRRALDDPSPQRIRGSDGASTPAISPDGRAVAFATADGGIEKVRFNDGSEVRVTSTTVPAGLSWSSRFGLIMGMPAYSRTMQGLSRSADTAGSLIRAVTKPSGEMNHFPYVLADDKRALLTSIGPNGDRLAVASLASGTLTQLALPVRRVVGVAGDVLVYLGADGALMAVRFDARRDRVVGDPVRVADAPDDIDHAVMARNGTLAMYLRPHLFQSVLLDEHGAGAQLVSDTVTWLVPRFSADGRRLALAGNFRGISATWIDDLTNGTLVRLGGPPRHLAVDWTPTDSAIVTAAVGLSSVRSQRAEGGGVTGLFRDPKLSIVSVAVSPDGQLLALGTAYGAGGFDIFLRRLSGDTALIPFATSDANEAAPRFSPDGHWLAYASDQSGRFEVYVRAVNGSGATEAISDSGGGEPVWSRDGRRLFYRTERGVMAADLDASASGLPRVIRRTHLFDGDFYSLTDGTGVTAAYDVSPDGHHFVMARAVGGAVGQIVIWANWIGDVERQLSAGR